MLAIRISNSVPTHRNGGSFRTMKKPFILLLILLLTCVYGIAMSDPLPIDGDLSGSFELPYEDDQPSVGSFVYSWRYPHISGDDPSASQINSFYQMLENDARNYDVPMRAEMYRSDGISARYDIHYEVHCNNDDFFSVLILTDITEGDEHFTRWEGNTFSRREGMTGLTFDLPRLLGKLKAMENDEFIETRQTEKINEAVRSLVLKKIRENPDQLPFYPDILPDDLMLFSPDADFYLDENGQPVFYVYPGDVAPPENGYMIFPLTLEEIDDEL